MTKIFKTLIDWNVEVYIGDIVVKNKTKGEHALHLEKTFRLMRAYNMKLNSNQIKAIMETPTPSNKKELQCSRVV